MTTHGYDVPTAAEATRRVPCSACGLSQAAPLRRRPRGRRLRRRGHRAQPRRRGGRAARQHAAMGRRLPVAPAARAARRGGGFPRKVKPLVRLTERETAAWCIVRGIDYQVEECPMAAGNRHLGYKATLNELEARSPGSKATFYLSFLESMVAAAGRPPARRRSPASSPCSRVRCTDDRRDVRAASRAGRRSTTGPVELMTGRAPVESACIGATACRR